MLLLCSSPALSTQLTLALLLPSWVGLEVFLVSDWLSLELDGMWCSGDHTFALQLERKEKKSERNERSHIIFIYFCCFTCTIQLQAPVEMSAAPQKYHFQVERQIFPRLQFGSAALFFFVFRGQIYSAFNLNILGR